MCFFFFFFKQKTAYEMRISDWSSDVCSSDLVAARGRRDYRVRSVSITSFSAGYGAVREIVRDPEQWRRVRCIVLLDSMYASYAPDGSKRPDPGQIEEIGRASCRERVCQYV